MPASEDLPEPAIDESMDDAVTTSAAQSEGPEPSAAAEPAQASTADDVRMELERAVNEPVPADDELHVSSKTPKPKIELVLEVSLDIRPEDISDNPMCLWGVLDECFQVTYVLRYPSESFPKKIRSCLKKQCKKNGILGLKIRLVHYASQRASPLKRWSKPDGY